MRATVSYDHRACRLLPGGISPWMWAFGSPHVFCVSGQDDAWLLSYVLLFPSWPATLTQGNFKPGFGATQCVL